LAPLRSKLEHNIIKYICIKGMLLYYVKTLVLHNKHQDLFGMLIKTCDILLNIQLLRSCTCHSIQLTKRFLWIYLTSHAFIQQACFFIIICYLIFFYTYNNKFFNASIKIYVKVPKLMLSIKKPIKRKTSYTYYNL